MNTWATSKIKSKSFIPDTYESFSNLHDMKNRIRISLVKVFNEKQKYYIYLLIHWLSKVFYIIVQIYSKISNRITFAYATCFFHELFQLRFSGIQSWRMSRIHKHLSLIMYIKLSRQYSKIYKFKNIGLNLKADLCK